MLFALCINCNFGVLAVGEDYLFSPMTITFSPDDTAMSVDFGTLDDNVVEVDEQFSFILSLPQDPPPDYEATSQALVTLIDNDCEMGGVWGCVLQNLSNTALLYSC